MTAEQFKKKPRRTWRRWLLRAALGFLVMVALSIGATWVSLMIESSKGQKELARVLAELDESDPRWRWEDIEADRTPVPDDENVMLVIPKAIEAMGDWKPWDLKQDNGEPLMDDRPAANRRLDEPRLAILRKAVDAQEKPIALALSLKDYQRGQTPMHLSSDLISTLLPHAQPVRQVAYLLELDIERQLHDNRPAAVADRIRAILRGGAGLREDPYLICHLVRLAICIVAIGRVERLLGMAEVDEATCRRLADDFRVEPQENQLLVGLRGERAGWHRVFENLKSGKLPLARFLHEASGNTGDPDLALQLGSLAYAYRLTDDHAFMLERMNDQCDIARLPIEEQAAARKQFDVEYRASRAKAGREFRKLFSHLMMPGLRIGEAAIREYALRTCALVALAAERFRLANKRWPKSIEELCPTFLKDVPVDPCDGEPLRYQIREDGLVIYSVGKDGDDNNGNLNPKDVPGTDIGFRLYNPDQRNLPALKAEKPADKQ